MTADLTQRIADAAELERLRAGREEDIRSFTALTQEMGEIADERDRYAAALHDIAALVSPQWRTSHGEDYTQGRNDLIDAVRAVLSRHGVTTDQAEQVKESLSRLDGTDSAAVSMMTGLSQADLRDLGGVDQAEQQS